jgi:replicative DNA helicase
VRKWQYLISLGLEAENAVIGAILLDSSCIHEVAAILQPDDMSMGAHRTILETAYAMYYAGEVIDPVTITAKLAERGQPVSNEYIMGLWEVTPTTTNVTEYAEIVKKESIIRSLKNLGDQLAHDEITDPFQAITDVSTTLETISKGVPASTVNRMDLCKAFMAYRAEIDKHGAEVYVKTGFSGLDHLLGGGLLNEGLYIVGARPAMGKSTFSLAVADNMAMRGDKLLYITLEMSEKQLTAKRLSRLSGVPSNIILMGMLGKEEYSKVATATIKLSESKLYVNRKLTTTVSEIGAMASNIKGLRCVVVDYLGLIRPSDRRKSRYEEMTEISCALKVLARRLQIPILCLAQLNRANEQRGNKRPQLSDLRDTGAIEQDADGVIFLHRDDYYADEKLNPWDARKLDVILAKNRHGATGIETMAFYPAVSKIMSVKGG